MCNRDLSPTQHGQQPDLISGGCVFRLLRMPTAQIFERMFRGIYGKPCWNVKPGLGSFLTLEFGLPHLEVREPIVASKSASPKVQRLLARRNVFVHGEWHLWIYCCNWEVLTKDKRIADSSTKARIRLAADVLDGQKLVRFSLDPKSVQCAFKFDLGATLRTVPYDKDSEQWSLYTPKQRVLTLFADRRYRCVHSDLPGDQGAWKPVLN
jgi:hypothetical protein